MLIDIGAPIILRHLRALGVGDVLALTIGGMVTAINAVVGAVRRRRADSIGLLVVAEIALSIALLLNTEDPPDLADQRDFYVGFAGPMPCLVGKPIGYESAKAVCDQGRPSGSLRTSVPGNARPSSGGPKE